MEIIEKEGEAFMPLMTTCIHFSVLKGSCSPINAPKLPFCKTFRPKGNPNHLAKSTNALIGKFILLSTYDKYIKF